MTFTSSTSPQRASVVRPVLGRHLPPQPQRQPHTVVSVGMLTQELVHQLIVRQLSRTTFFSYQRQLTESL